MENGRFRWGGGIAELTSLRSPAATGWCTGLSSALPGTGAWEWEVLCRNVFTDVVGAWTVAMDLVWELNDGHARRRGRNPHVITFGLPNRHCRIPRSQQAGTLRQISGEGQ